MQLQDAGLSHPIRSGNNGNRIVLCGYSLLPVAERACDLLLQKPRLRKLMSR
jgi:hypothetical protein